jgi:hypothetical protein
MKRRTFLRAGLASTALAFSPLAGGRGEERNDKDNTRASAAPVKAFEFE